MIIGRESGERRGLQQEFRRRKRRRGRYEGIVKEKKRENKKEKLITFLSFSFDWSNKQKQGAFCPSENVLVAKIDLHENEWVYCSKLHIYIYIYIYPTTNCATIPFLW